MVGGEYIEHARSDASNIRRVWQQSRLPVQQQFAEFFGFSCTSVEILVMVVCVRLFWSSAN